MMHPYLERDGLLDPQQRTLRRALRAGPWFWPEEWEDRDAVDRAVSISGLPGPPPMSPGMALLAAVGRQAEVSLWVLEPAASESQSSVELGPQARQAWDVAGVALPRSMPVLWSSVRGAHERAPRVRMSFHGPPSGGLDGASFGLALLLSMASNVLGRATDRDFIALAGINEQGNTLPVEGLREKIGGVARCAPGVSRVLVCATQLDAAREVADRVGLDALPVVSANEAISQVFPDLHRLLVELGSHEEGRREFVETLFRLAAGDRGATVAWAPVHMAATLALDTSGWGLSESDRWKLEFARAVALRHEKNAGAMQVPPREWLLGLAQPLRLWVVAHVVQQSADSGVPSGEEAVDLASQHLVRGLDAFEGHLRLLGALGRLEAACGKPEEALELQQECARGWLERRLYRDSSYALCEWFRLAGALRLGESFEAAQQCLDQVVSLIGSESYWTRWARGRGLVLLGRNEEALPLLLPLARDRRLEDHVPASAARWAAEAAGAGPLATEMRERVQAAPEPHRDVYLKLMDLDHALREGDDDRAAGLLAELQTIEVQTDDHPRPGTRRLIERLVATRDRRLFPDPAAYVQRFYPY